jgi:NTP pyrophosphatase (non-canonical NTP hydrolase)
MNTENKTKEKFFIDTVTYTAIRQPFEQIRALVVQWFRDRRIVPNSTAATQTLKAVSEMGELADAVLKGDRGKIVDGVGDVTVCLIGVCELLGLDFVACLEAAYDEIKDRKGVLLPNGVFAKEVAE